MAFSIPSLLERSRSVHAAIRARIAGADGEIWPNNLRIIGKVVAMAAHEADLRAAYLFRQIFTSSADGAYLDLHAYEVGLVRKPATAATGLIVVPATTGILFAAGLRFVRDDGATFVSIGAATAVADAVSIPVEAEDPGSAGNSAPGASMTLDVSTPDLADEGLVGPGGLAGGIEGEGDATLRARILFRKRKRPRGGSDDDYVAWATEVPLVAAAFAKGWAPGAGAVSVWPLKAGSGTARIPTTQDLDIVAAYLETKRPSAATVYVLQASPHVIDITIAGLADDTLAIRAEILAELDDEFDARARVVKPDENTSFSRSWIDEAISAAIGEDRHRLTVPAVDPVLVPGEFPVRGTVTFV